MQKEDLMPTLSPMLEALRASRPSDELDERLDLSGLPWTEQTSRPEGSHAR